MGLFVLTTSPRTRRDYGNLWRFVDMRKVFRKYCVVSHSTPFPCKFEGINGLLSLIFLSVAVDMFSNFSMLILNISCKGGTCIQDAYIYCTTRHNLTRISAPNMFGTVQATTTCVTNFFFSLMGLCTTGWWDKFTNLCVWLIGGVFRIKVHVHNWL